MEFDFKGNMELMFERFEKFLTEKTVIGEPIKMDGVTLIPAVTISFGMGNGGGGEVDNKGTGGNGSGGGFGAKITPCAVIVIKDDLVQIMPISKGNAFEKIIDMVPDLIDKIDEKTKKEDKEV